MQVFREIEKNMFNASSLALGVFDGVHTGHQKVIKSAVENAIERHIISAVVTFSQHPRSIITDSAPEILTSLEDRLDIFKALGVNAVIILDFTKELAKMTAHEYLENILQDCLNVKNISVGVNHKFGSDRKGPDNFLRRYCSENDINLSAIPSVKINNHVVSSSVIRKLILAGDVSSAGEYLGRPFKLRGKVIEGQHLGRKIGFPTANMLICKDMIIPLRGVYAGKASVKGKVYDSVINVGKRPTVGNFEKDLVESHILNFDQDIYGEEIDVFFLQRIREEIKFSSLEELKKQIEIDCRGIGSVL